MGIGIALTGVSTATAAPIGGVDLGNAVMGDRPKATRTIAAIHLFRSLIPGLDVKLSPLILAEPLVLSAVEALPSA
jgi:hypothetical protein